MFVLTSGGISATALAPPLFLEKLEKEGRLTPMKTVLDAVDVFITPASKVTGDPLYFG